MFERIARTRLEVRPLMDKYAAAGMGRIEPAVPGGKSMIVRRNRASRA